jgi:Ni/Fe-hydrogenase subunit HybB-like protein
MSLLWVYFTVSEHLTTWYGNSPAEMRVFGERVRGRFAPYFWFMVFCNFVLPFVLLSIRRLRSVATITIAGVAVLIGMWVERFLIILPTLSRPHLPAAAGFYTPTWVEISITASTFAAMVMFYLIFCKLFPIIAVWEYKHVSHG